MSAIVEQRGGTTAAGPPAGDEAWAAVLARDALWDGRFVYAVATTGVYCRPVCPARRPRRENVSFFASPGAAEAAGFRACRRCRPAGGGPAASVRAVERARTYLEDHLDERVTLERLARVAHMSAWHLQRTFKRVVGVSPRGYVEARRAERLKAELRRGGTVSRATFEAGYGSTSRVYEQAPARLGMTPAEYRRGGAGMEIGFTIVDSPLGRLLAARTERGLCAVTLGDDDAALEEALRAEYPRARIARADDGLGAWTGAIVACLEGGGEPLDLPLDLQATAFRHRVWDALREIPPGATLSYGELAARLGAPRSARAVGRACAGNPVALVVPCHRVVRGDGALGGYRWGLERKRRLLELEAAHRGAPPRDGEATE